MCTKLQIYAQYWPAAIVLLSGLKAVSQQLNIRVPRESRACFVSIEDRLPTGSDGDVPIAWAIPQHAELMELLTDDGTESESQRQSTVELGLVIAKWNRMSVTA